MILHSNKHKATPLPVTTYRKVKQPMSQSKTKSPPKDQDLKTTNQPHLNLRWLSFYATIITLIGGLSIRFVLIQIYPSLISKGLLFGLIFITSTALVMPVAAYFNHRFAAEDWRIRDSGRLMRQGIEGGILMVSVAYLQLIQALDSTLLTVLVGVFVLMETFFMTHSKE